MVSRRRIIWSPIAKTEKRKIFRFWNKKNKSKIYSKKLNGLFNAKAIAVAENPFIGRRTDVDNTRVVVVRNNLIFYEIFETQIVILSIWEGHQNPENLEI